MPIVEHDKLIRHFSTAGDFTLTPKAGRAYEITELGFHGYAANAIADIRIGGKPIMSLPIAEDYDNLALPRGIRAPNTLFFDYLKEISPDYDSFKVSQGRTLRVTTTTTEGSIYVRYREWDEPKEDFIAAVLGENSPKVPYIAHGKAEGSIPAGTTVYLSVNKSLNPKEYLDFPFEAKAPAGRKLTLIGLCTAKGPGTGAGIVYEGIKAVDKDGTNIFGYEEEYTDINFFLYPRAAVGGDFFRLAMPLVFTEDDEMWLTVKVKNTAAAAETAVITVTMVFNNEPMA